MSRTRVMLSSPLAILLLAQHTAALPTPRNTNRSILNPRYPEFDYGHGALTKTQIIITAIFIVIALVLLSYCCWICRKRKNRSKLHPTFYPTQQPLQERRDYRAPVYRPTQVNDMELPAYTAYAADGERVVVPKAAHTYS